MTVHTGEDAQFDDTVRRMIYSHFSSSGTSVRRSALAQQLNSTTAAVDAAFQRLAAQRALVLDVSGEVAMAIPFSAVATDVVVHDSTTHWWAPCAFDGIGIGAMLQRDVTLQTICPGSGSPITVQCGPSGISGDDCILHLSVPMAQFWHDIGAT